ncbi:MAG: DNA-directed DNA polymerase II small subunit [Candidatus Woesearchaeota archaeon]|nr:DNA-directed DNA polymerase II small subunit [Candidatus Woesearchaeota archaeon]
MMEQEKKQRITKLSRMFLEKGLLLSPDILEKLSIFEGTEEIDKAIESIARILLSTSEENMMVVTEEAIDFIKRGKEINWADFEKAKTLSEKKKDNKIYDKFIEYAHSEEKAKTEENPHVFAENRSGVTVLESYDDISKKRTVQDFVDYFNARYRGLEAMLRNREELQNLMSISRAKKKTEREIVSVIGMVSSKDKTKNGNIIMKIEDQTGETKVLFNKSKHELLMEGEDTVLDEVIGVCGVSAKDIIFVNSIVRPEIPSIIEKKGTAEEEYAIFLSDLHVGSKNFLSEEFGRFLKWINADAGTEAQKDIAKKIKYVFIAGDLIDGVGIYADQDEDLLTKDVSEQYTQCAELLSKIPQSMQIIISPGNHDAMRIAEPQPMLYRDFAAAIWKLPNITMLSNPAMVNIASSEGFSGFNVLIYHGYSFDYYASDVESIRVKGGYDRADLIMKFLLQRRHLAPSQTSTQIIPDHEKDPLLITKIPDIFLTGHIHKCSVSHYKNIVLISGSCWQSKTAFQERVGHHPEPARVPIMNLKTGEIKILKFEK